MKSFHIKQFQFYTNNLHEGFKFFLIVSSTKDPNELKTGTRLRLKLDAQAYCCAPRYL